MREQIKKTAIEIAAITLLVAAIWYAFKISTISKLPESEASWWLRTSELLLVASTILLAAGLVGEWSDSESWKKKVLYKVAKAAVVIGVMGELLGDGGIFNAGDRVGDLQREKIIALEKQLAPRFLAIGPFIEKMHLSSGTKFDVAVMLNVEPVFVNQLVMGLKFAGWQLESFPGPPESTFNFAGLARFGLLALQEGVEIQYDPKSDPLVKSAAEALAKALNEAKIEASARGIEYSADAKITLPTNMVRLMIGAKPLHE